MADIIVVQDELGRVWSQALIRTQLLHPDAKLPEYGNSPTLDNGVDLFAKEEVRLAPGEKRVVGLGIAVQLPKGWGLFVLPRSGTSLKTDLRVANAPGLVDHGYRNEVGVITHNTGDDVIVIPKHTRIAQAVLLFTPIMCFQAVEALDSEDRAGGFGSTGGEVAR